MPKLIAPTGGRVDAVLAEALPELSRSRCTALVRQGRVRVNGTLPARPSSKVHVGDTLEVDLPPPTPAEARPQDLPVRFVYEDEHLVVVDKDPGMVVHPGAGHPDGTLVNALLHHVGDLSGIGGVQRPGIVHRLDKGTSGLLVVAKGDAAHQHLAAQFAAHSAGRTYLALCLGAPVSDGGVIRSRLARHPRDRVRWASTLDPDHGKEAVTHWVVQGRAHGVCLVRCTLETGRTHQVRVHLTELGLPLVGDPLYKRRGHPLPEPLRGLVHDDRPLLHAWRLHLAHPADGRPMSFEAPLPADFIAALEAVGLSSPGR